MPSKKPSPATHASIKVWAATYQMLIDIHRAMPGHPTHTQILHDAVTGFAAQLNATEGYAIPIREAPPRRYKQAQVEASEE